MMNDIKADGNRSYLIAIVMAAVLGGLLFGYDTAVISELRRVCRHSSWRLRTFSMPTDGTDLPMPRH